MEEKREIARKTKGRCARQEKKMKVYLEANTEKVNKVEIERTGGLQEIKERKKRARNSKERKDEMREEKKKGKLCRRKKRRRKENRNTQTLTMKDGSDAGAKKGKEERERIKGGGEGKDEREGNRGRGKEGIKWKETKIKE